MRPRSCSRSFTSDDLAKPLRGVADSLLSAAVMTPLFVAALLATAPNLQTLAEQTQFQKTGRYEEAVTLCGAFEKAYPNKARCDTFGTTPEGRPMVALVVSDGALTPEDSKKKLRPVMLFQGGIH